MTPHPLRSLCVIVAAIALGASSLAACGLQPSRRVLEPVGPSLSSSFSLQARAAAPAPAIVAEPVILGTLEVRAANLAFDERNLAVAAPGRYEVHLRNDDSVAHEVIFDDGTSIAAGPGEEVTAVVEIPVEGSTFLCAFPAHRDAGMVGQVSVTE